MTRWRKASALAGGVIVVVVAAFGAYEYLSNSPATPAVSAAAHPQDTTVYYSDGKTVLGTFGAAGPQHRNNSDPWVPYLMTQVDNELTGIDGVSQQQIQAGGLGATTQYSLVVGMFTANPVDKDDLAELGGGGSASYWPAKIWNTFAAAEFAKTPTPFPANPPSAGQAWNQVG